MRAFFESETTFTLTGFITRNGCEGGGGGCFSKGCSGFTDTGRVESVIVIFCAITLPAINKSTVTITNRFII